MMRTVGGGWQNFILCLEVRDRGTGEQVEVHRNKRKERRTRTQG